MEKVKIYHVETQEDYDDLMVNLENKGYRWLSGDKPTAKNCWFECEEETVICLNEVIDREIRFSSLGYTKREYPDINIIKHKAKGVKQMEKVVVPRCVADWYEEYGSNDLHKTLDRYLNNEGTSNELVQWEKSFGGTHRNNLNNAQDILAKMHLYDYEVEEKKYHWRKKKEYLCDFEHHRSNNYLNLDGDERLFFSDKAEISLCTTKFTETKLRELVSEEDLNKLERVEIDDVQ